MFIRDYITPSLELKLKSLQLTFYAIVRKLQNLEGVFLSWSYIHLSLRKKTGPQLGGGSLAGYTVPCASDIARHRGNSGRPAGQLNNVRQEKYNLLLY